jgi:hypothetical protein
VSSADDARRQSPSPRARRIARQLGESAAGASYIALSRRSYSSSAALRIDSSTGAFTGNGAALSNVRLKTITSRVDSKGTSLVVESSEPVPYVTTRPDALTVVLELRNVAPGPHEIVEPSRFR